MAIVIFSDMIGRIVGRSQGTVYQNGKYGTIRRTEGFHTKSSANNISRTKSNLAEMQAAWRNLSSQDRQLWEVYAQFRNRATKKISTNKLGGQSTFILENSIRLIHNQSGGGLVPELITTPVISPPPGNIAFTSLNFDGVDFSYDTDQTFNTADAFFIIYLSQPLLSSQMSIWNKKKIFALPLTAGNNQILTSQYLAKFGTLPAVGQFINSEIALYDKAKNTFGSFTKQRTEVTP